MEEIPNNFQNTREAEYETVQQPRIMEGNGNVRSGGNESYVGTPVDHGAAQGARSLSHPMKEPTTRSEFESGGLTSQYTSMSMVPPRNAVPRPSQPLGQFNPARPQVPAHAPAVPSLSSPSRRSLGGPAYSGVGNVPSLRPSPVGTSGTLPMPLRTTGIAPSTALPRNSLAGTTANKPPAIATPPPPPSSTRPLPGTMQRTSLARTTAIPTPPPAPQSSTFASSSSSSSSARPLPGTMQRTSLAGTTAIPKPPPAPQSSTFASSSSSSSSARPLPGTMQRTSLAGTMQRTSLAGTMQRTSLAGTTTNKPPAIATPPPPPPPPRPLASTLQSPPVSGVTTPRSPTPSHRITSPTSPAVPSVPSTRNINPLDQPGQTASMTDPFYDLNAIPTIPMTTTTTQLPLETPPVSISSTMAMENPSLMPSIVQPTAPTPTQTPTQIMPTPEYPASVIQPSVTMAPKKSKATTKKKSCWCWCLPTTIVLTLAAVIFAYVYICNREVVITSDNTSIPLYTVKVLVKSTRSDSMDLTNLELHDYPWMSSIVADFNAFRYIHSVKIQKLPQLTSIVLYENAFQYATEFILEDLPMLRSLQLNKYAVVMPKESHETNLVTLQNLPVLMDFQLNDNFVHVGTFNADGLNALLNPNPKSSECPICGVMHKNIQMSERLIQYVNNVDLCNNSNCPV